MPWRVASPTLISRSTKAHNESFSKEWHNGEDMTQRVSAFCVWWRVRLFPFNSLIISRMSFKPRLTFSLSRLGSRERERLRFSVSQVMQYKSLFRPRLKLFIYTKAHCVHVWSCPLCLPATGHLIPYYWMRKMAEERTTDPHPLMTRIPLFSHRLMEEMCRETLRSFGWADLGTVKRLVS